MDPTVLNALWLNSVSFHPPLLKINREISQPNKSQCWEVSLDIPLPFPWLVAVFVFKLQSKLDGNNFPEGKHFKYSTISMTFGTMCS